MSYRESQEKMERYLERYRDLDEVKEEFLMNPETELGREIARAVFRNRGPLSPSATSCPTTPRSVTPPPKSPPKVPETPGAASTPVEIFVQELIQLRGSTQMTRRERRIKKMELVDGFYEQLLNSRDVTDFIRRRKGEPDGTPIDGMKYFIQKTQEFLKDFGSIGITETMRRGLEVHVERVMDEEWKSSKESSTQTTADLGGGLVLVMTTSLVLFSR